MYRWEVGGNLQWRSESRTVGGLTPALLSYVTQARTNFGNDVNASRKSGTETRSKVAPILTLTELPLN